MGANGVAAVHFICYLKRVDTLSFDRVNNRVCARLGMLVVGPAGFSTERCPRGTIAGGLVIAFFEEMEVPVEPV